MSYRPVRAPMPTLEPAYRNSAAGLRCGTRVVVEEVPPTVHGRRVRVLCDCGRRTTLPLTRFRTTTGCQRCSTVGKTLSRPHLERLLREARERCPEVWLSDEPPAVEAVGELVDLLGGMTLNEVGALLGVTRERIRQIEQRAIGPAMRLRCELAGLTPSPDPEPGLWDIAELAGCDA